MTKATSLVKSETEGQSIVAECPAGKEAIGGGGRVIGAKVTKVAITQTFENTNVTTGKTDRLVRPGEADRGRDRKTGASRRTWSAPNSEQEFRKAWEASRGPRKRALPALLGTCGPPPK